MRDLIIINKRWVGLIGLSLSILLMVIMICFTSNIIQTILCIGIVIANIISMIMLVYEINISVKWKGELDKLIVEVIYNTNRKEEGNE